MSLTLKRQLCVSYPSARLLHHKILATMAQRDAEHRLNGAVQFDDVYLGGERAGGKTGRGSENRIPFVAACCWTQPAVHGISSSRCG